MLVDLAFNAGMLAVDAAALLLVARRPHPAAAAAGVFGCGVLALPGAAAVQVARGWTYSFTYLRLAAWTSFLHVPLVLLGAAWLLRRERPRWAAACAGLAAACVAVAGNAFLVEPYRLQVTRYAVESREISARVRIGVLADLQTDRVGPYERRALEALAAEEPDLVLLPGDYVHASDRPAWEREGARLNALLREVGLAAPLGAFAVRGNVEPPDWPLLFLGTGVTSVEETRAFDVGPLVVTGLAFGESRTGAAELQEHPGRFHVVFGHYPDFVLTAPPGDLFVAGHTHGGQVQIPLFGPPFTLSAVPRSWAAGRTELPKTLGGGTLVVSRGVGMERGEAPRLRFLCPPEVVVIDVVPDRGPER